MGGREAWMDAGLPVYRLSTNCLSDAMSWSLLISSPRGHTLEWEVVVNLKGDIRSAPIL
jgi:hypothetical protein